MDKNLSKDEKAMLVYTTIGGLNDAEKLGDSLVNGGLAACVNIIPGVLSIYESGGRLVRDHEAIMIIKSRENLKPRLLEALKRLHPYELPSIMVIEPDQCDEDYMDWIQFHTSRKGKGVH